LFTSSGAVYGSQLCDHIQETAKMHTDPLRAESGLALGKSVAEFLLSQAGTESGLEVVIARCFSFVGPGIPMNLHYAIGNFIKNTIEGKPIVIKGDGSAIRSYMFMGDLIWWLLKLLLDGKSGEAYNVGSNKPISILELAHRVSQLRNTSPEVVVLGQAEYTVGVPVRDIYVPSIDKASNLLNLDTTTELRKSLIYTFNDFNE
jgi:dTDP-glucose 4,6-dehydratase/UDP-glucose 4-epimerase